MIGDAQYKLEAVDRVFQDMGCVAETNRVTRDQRAWIRKLESGRVIVEVYTFEDGNLLVPESTVADFAHRLELDVGEVIKRLKAIVGEYLGP